MSSSGNLLDWFWCSSCKALLAVEISRCIVGLSGWKMAGECVRGRAGDDDVLADLEDEWKMAEEGERRRAWKGFMIHIYRYISLQEESDCTG